MVVKQSKKLKSNCERNDRSNSAELADRPTRIKFQNTDSAAETARSLRTIAVLGI